MGVAPESYAAVMGNRQVRATRTIAAGAQDIFALLVDPARHPLIDGSGSVRRASAGAPQRLELGSTFGMDMKIGVSYRIENTVVEYERDASSRGGTSTATDGGGELEPAEEGRTRVTETFDWSTARIPLPIGLGPVPGLNRKAIENSLERLAGIFPG